VAADVRATIIDGHVLMREGSLASLDEHSVVEEANREAAALRMRAGIKR